MARRRVRGMAVVVGGVVATLVAGLLTALPAGAAGGPVLTSISVNTRAVTAPGEVVLSYTATTTAPVDEALAGDKDPAGRLYSVNLSKGASGSGTRKIPDGVQNGTWKLQYVYLTYSPTEFTFVCSPAYASTAAKCTEARDLSAYDVAVSGSTEDFDGPTLSSVTVAPTAIEPGAPVTMRFVAADLHPVVKAACTSQGEGALASRVKVSAGCRGLGALFSARDADGDGDGDLGAITMAGDLRIYKGRGNATFTSATVVSRGWAAYL